LTSLFFLAAAAAASGADPVSLNIGTLSAIALAILLAISGLIQRSTKRGPVVIECPNKIEELWPRLDEIGRTVEGHDEGAGGAIEEIHELAKLHKARDADGVFRWYGRDQGTKILVQNEKILSLLGDLVREVEVMNRLRRNGNGGGPR